MHDVLQQAMYAFATQSGAATKLVVFCAQYLVFVMALAWLGAAFMARRQLTLDTLVRIVALVVVAYVVAKVLNHVVVDTRPYLIKADHETALTGVSSDNGFPSDHALLAAAITTSLWWINRRLIWPFAVLTVFVMLGRLGIGAHHTLDVVGSVVIVIIVATIVALLPLPAALDRPLLASSEASAPYPDRRRAM
ncbi:MAG TPA: phosphatase PAP2 family protein [Ktedonobacterales bacterium]